MTDRLARVCAFVAAEHRRCALSGLGPEVPAGLFAAGLWSEAEALEAARDAGGYASPYVALIPLLSTAAARALLDDARLVPYHRRWIEARLDGTLAEPEELPSLMQLIRAVEDARAQAAVTFARLRAAWIASARGEPVEEDRGPALDEEEPPAARRARLEAELTALERGETPIAYHTLRVAEPDDPEALHLRARALVDRAPLSLYRPELLSEMAMSAPPSLVRARVRDVLDAFARDGFREENQGAIPFWLLAARLTVDEAREALALAVADGSYAAWYGVQPLLERLIALGEPAAPLVDHARGNLIPAKRVACWVALVPHLDAGARGGLVAELLAWLAREPLPPLPRGHEDAYSSGQLDARELVALIELVAVTPPPERPALFDALDALVAARPALLGGLDLAADALARAGDPEPTRARRWLRDLSPDIASGALPVEERLALADRDRRAGRAVDPALVDEARALWEALGASGRTYLVSILWDHAAWLPIEWLARAFDAWLDVHPRPAELADWAPALRRVIGDAVVTAVAEAFSDAARGSSA